MLNSLLRNRIQYVFGIAGIVFVLLSMFSVQDITKLQVTFVASVRLAPLITGVCFILLSIIWHIAPHLSVPLSWTAVSKVASTPDGFQTTIAHAHIEVCFGQIQKLFEDNHRTLVVLPANDLFDDECIHDKRSALGAFVNHFFPNKAHEISSIVKAELRKETARNPGQKSSVPQRYDIGKTVYFERPLSRDLRMAFLAVTTVTDKEGIRCEAPDIFTSIKGLHRLMNTKRLDAVLLPVIGSGHGGLRPPISLICMLIAFAERLREPSGHHIKRVRIVVHQKDKRTKPAISYWQVRRLLAYVQRYC